MGGSDIEPAAHTLQLFFLLGQYRAYGFMMFNA